MASRPSSPLILPFVVACFGIALFSAMDAVMKHLAIEIGANNALLWRVLLSMPMLLPVYLIRGGRWPARPVLMLHIGRNISVTISLLLFFWALKYLPLALGIALSFVAPLIALGLASLFLHERVGRSAVGASLLAFLGVIVIVIGHGAHVHLDSAGWLPPLAILGAAVLYAVSIVAGRALSQRAKPLEIAVFFNVVACVLCIAMAGISGATLPAWEDVPLILMASLFANTSIMLIAWAYARAETQHLVAVEYTAFLWAAILGWLFFAEPVALPTLAGAALIVGGCLWAARGGRPRADS